MGQVTAVLGYLGVTEAYIQGGTEIQVVYPTDLYLPTILQQFEQL